MLSTRSGGRRGELNGSCGVSTYLNKRVWPERSVERVFVPPKDLRGRAGALIVKRASLRVLYVVLYFAPRGSLRECMDLNDGLGLPPESSLGVADGLVGPVAPSQEGANALELRKLLADSGLMVVNTWLDAGIT